jgi:hypothetical protein
MQAPALQKWQLTMQALPAKPNHDNVDWFVTGMNGSFWSQDALLHRERS